MPWYSMIFDTQWLSVPVAINLIAFNVMCGEEIAVS